jgi:16S rRNA (uracil1498-N3)-methyltransferase
VSLPLFLVPELPTRSVYTLDGAEGRHAATVQRLTTGERLLLGDGRGGLAEAVVTAVRKGTLELSIGDRREVAAPEPRIVAAQALAKGDRGELAVQMMTEVGVDEIIPWAAARSITQWKAERGEKAWQRWEATIREATKQARRAWLPGLAPQASTASLTKRIQASRTALVLHEEASEAIGSVPLAAGGDLVLVVGPEGGVTPDELEALQTAGAVPVRMGEPVLRTSTAGAAAIAALSVRLGRW